MVSLAGPASYRRTPARWPQGVPRAVRCFCVGAGILRCSTRPRRAHRTRRSRFNQLGKPPRGCEARIASLARHSMADTETVTVVFSDLVGSTELAGHLGHDAYEPRPLRRLPRRGYHASRDRDQNHRRRADALFRQRRPSGRLWCRPAAGRRATRKAGTETCRHQLLCFLILIRSSGGRRPCLSSGADPRRRLCRRGDAGQRRPLRPAGGRSIAPVRRRSAGTARRGGEAAAAARTALSRRHVTTDAVFPMPAREQAHGALLRSVRRSTGPALHELW